MEHREGPVEVQGRQDAGYGQRPAQAAAGPEAGTVARQGAQGQALFPPQSVQHQQHRYAHRQHPKVQQKQPPHIGEVAGPLRGEGQHTGGKVRALAQAVIHHVVKGRPDLLHRQAAAGGDAQRLDLGPVEGPDQQRQGDGSGQDGQGHGKGRENGQ